MTTKVYLSTLGRPVDPQNATISVFDRGFLYGDSVYETMRTSLGRPVELRRHLERLRRSADGIGLDLPFDQSTIQAAITSAHNAAGNDESYVRVVVTRGTGPLALDARKSESPTLVVIVQSLTLPPPSAYENGIAAVFVEVHKTSSLIDPGLKTGNYLNNILALRHATSQGGDDAILVNDAGEVAEAATSNVFVVKDGKLRTPALGAGLLAGITREVVCELAAGAGLPPAEDTITPDELRAADEVFTTSSVRGIMPVTRIDGAKIGNGKVGPVTQDLIGRYTAYLTRDPDGSSW